MQPKRASNPARDVVNSGDVPLELGYDTAMQLAVEAFDIMRLYKTPPIPEAYEIFYAYASRSPVEVIERIKQAAAVNGFLDLHQIHGIHSELFSYPEALRHQQEATNEKLDTELAAVLELVESHLRRNADHSASLSEAGEDISKATSPMDLRRTIEKLLAENEKTQIETKKLAKSLEVSQSSIQDMRIQLANAREAGLRDALTRLYNRRHFDSVLPAEIQTAQENEGTLSLVMVDVDHFKKINDNFGHPAGDAVLRVLGKMLADNVKGRDIPVRYGGEEFAIILPETSADGAQSLANEIRRQLERKKLVLRDTKQDIGQITASFGVAEARNDDTSSTLIARADQMLYKAKRTGRNKVVCTEDD